MGNELKGGGRANRLFVIKSIAEYDQLSDSGDCQSIRGMRY